MRWVRLLIRNGREDDVARSIEHELPVRSHYGRPIGPILDIGTWIDGEDKIDIPLFLQQWPQWDILEILAAIDQRDIFEAWDEVGRAVEATEGIGVDGNVFLCFIEDLEDCWDD
jgi:hypothetical protein